jgi:hypothetical protein
MHDVPHLFSVALYKEKAHTLGMITVTRFTRLCVVVIALVFCASAFADPNKNVVLPATQQPVKTTAKKMCYTNHTSSRIPMPCNRLAAIPTTSSPTVILGMPNY